MAGTVTGTENITMNKRLQVTIFITLIYFHEGIQGNTKKKYMICHMVFNDMEDKNACAHCGQLMGKVVDDRCGHKVNLVS